MLLTTNASPVQQHRQGIRELLLTRRRRCSTRCCSQRMRRRYSSIGGHQGVAAHRKASVQHHQCCSQRVRRRYSSIGSASSELLFTTKASSVQHHRSCCSPRLRRGTLGGAAEPGPGLDRHLRDYHAMHQKRSATLRTTAERARSRVSVGAARHEEGPRTRARGKEAGAEAQKDLARRLEGPWLRRLTRRTLARGPT